MATGLLPDHKNGDADSGQGYWQQALWMSRESRLARLVIMLEALLA